MSSTERTKATQSPPEADMNERKFLRLVRKLQGTPRSDIPLFPECCTPDRRTRVLTASEGAGELDTRHTSQTRDYGLRTKARCSLHGTRDDRKWLGRYEVRSAGCGCRCRREKEGCLVSDSEGKRKGKGGRILRAVQVTCHNELTN